MEGIAGELKMRRNQVKGTVSEKKYFAEEVTNDMSRLIGGNQSSRLCPKGIACYFRRHGNARCLAAYFALNASISCIRKMRCVLSSAVHLLYRLE